MATLIKAVLGEVSGALGGLVFRHRDGKSYISTRAKSYTPAGDPASLARKKRFLLAIKVASAVNAITVLKQLWNIFKQDSKSAFTHLVKNNYPYTADENTLLKIIMTPGSIGTGFSLSNATVSVEPTGITLEADAIGAGTTIDTAVQVSIVMATVLMLDNPVDLNNPEYHFVSMISAPQPISLINPLLFTAAFGNELQVLYSAYQVKKSFSVLVTLNAANEPVHFSNMITG